CWATSRATIITAPALYPLPTATWKCTNGSTHKLNLPGIHITSGPRPTTWTSPGSSNTAPPGAETAPIRVHSPLGFFFTEMFSLLSDVFAPARLRHDHGAAQSAPLSFSGGGLLLSLFRCISRFHQHPMVHFLLEIR